MMLSTTGAAPSMLSLTGTHLHRGSPVSSLVLTGGWPPGAWALRPSVTPALGSTMYQSVLTRYPSRYINTIGTGTIGGKPIDSRPCRSKASSTQGPIGARPIGTSFNPLASALTAPRPTQLRPLGSALAAQPSRLGSLIGSALGTGPSAQRSFARPFRLSPLRLAWRTSRSALGAAHPSRTT